MYLNTIQQSSTSLLKCKQVYKLTLCAYSSGIGLRRSLPHNTIVKFVPQQEAWIIERFGKYYNTLLPGLNFLLPIIDEIKYVQSLKEIASEVPQQSAITKDNVSLNLDGVLFFRVVDPYQASYGVEDPQFAITQLAQTTMRSEIGKMALDEVFKERDTLNLLIVEAINSAAKVWGIKCLRYEIRDIQLPTKVRESMQMQVEAERKKRAVVLESEGQRESQINKASGEANALLATAKARAEAITMISNALNQASGNQAAALSVAEQYIQAFSQLAKTSNTVIIPANANNVSSMVAQAMAIYKSIDQKSDGHSKNDSQTTEKISSDSTSDKEQTLGFSGYKDISNLSSLGEFSVATSSTRKRDFT
ncbi:stomatin-like protein stl-1 isoform X1 [Hydra vulgaris]|uniref:stomatin-like protein stl-1 isoform X1 n=1 Tax=Hydra vulgaris TaxID=6087 RepID=UPI001F5FC1E9|nr:stomatin-like protein 2, mitochondrial [Hydra vulgaris]